MSSAGRPFTHTVTVTDDADAIANARPRVIVHVSDTHNRQYGNIPQGDILVHSGDFTDGGSKGETVAFNEWLRKQRHPYKVVVIGNHELGFDQMPHAVICKYIFAGVSGECHLLTDSAAVVDGVRFYGSPWNNITSQAFGGDEAFRASKWRLIPDDTDVLVTHNPPHGILDLAWQQNVPEYTCTTCGKTHRSHCHWGCRPLREAVRTRGIKVHMFGHVHDEAGVVEVDGTVFSNAAMDMAHRPSVITLLGVSESAGDDGTADTVVDAPLPKMLPLSQARVLNRTGVITIADAAAWKQNTAFVLDVDTHDATQRSVCLWKELAGHPPQQTWTVRVLSRLSDTELIVAIESVLSVGERDGGEARVLCAAHRDAPSMTLIRRSALVPDAAQWFLRLCDAPDPAFAGYQCATMGPFGLQDRMLGRFTHEPGVLRIVDASSSVAVQHAITTTWVLPY